MRILIAVHGFPPTYTSGAELRAERTARYLQHRGHDVIVVCVERISDDPNDWTVHEQVQQGILVHRIVFGYPAGDAQIRERYDNPHVNAAVQRAIKLWNPDVIHLFSGYLMGLGVVNVARANKIPVVVSLTDYWWLCHRINLVKADGVRCSGPTPFGCARCHALQRRTYRYPDTALGPAADVTWRIIEESHFLDKHFHVDEHERRERLLLDALNHVNVLISPSRYLARVYERHGVDATRLHVVRQGVDLDSFPLRTRSHTVRFAYFGQVKHHKGVHTIVDAWSRLVGDQPRSLAIYGSASGEERYATDLQHETRHMDNVIWHGKIPHMTIWNKLAETDMLIVASRWVENSPNIILEAQAMGVPVIGTNLGGVAELVQDDWNGLLFTPDSATSLAAQMQRVLDSPQLISEFRSHSLPTAHVLEEMAQLELLYAEACGALPPPTALRDQAAAVASERELEWLHDMANAEMSTYG